MSPLRIGLAAIVAFAASLTAIPALAFGFAIELPRLEFPTPFADSTRNCSDVAATCSPSGN